MFQKVDGCAVSIAKTAFGKMRPFVILTIWRGLSGETGTNAYWI
jgi:hypothetical protein